MEWAVGKQGEIMRENSGKLIKAGSSIVWDIHYHAVWEEITDNVELGDLPLSEGFPTEASAGSVCVQLDSKAAATRCRSRQTRSR